MSRLALLVSESGIDETLEPVLQRHGYSRVIHSSTLAQALMAVDEQSVDVLDASACAPLSA